MPSIEGMFTLVRNRPDSVMPMSPSAVEAIGDALELMQDEVLQFFFRSDASLHAQPVRGFQHLSAAVVLESDRHGLDRVRDLAMMKGFRSRLKITESTTSSELVDEIKASLDFDVNDAWRVALDESARRGRMQRP